MYCKQCGEKMTNEKAVICVRCGTSKGQGVKYCPECGVEVKNQSAEVCLNCGVRLKGGASNFTSQINNITSNTENNKSKMMAGLLAFFLGGAGVHRFYLGYKQIGFIQLGIFVAALILYAPVIWICWIWAIMDIYNIFAGKLPNSNGTELV